MNSGIKSNAKVARAAKKVCGALWWVALAVLAAVMFSIIGAKMQGKVPRILGYSVVKIISGSMEDTIPEGTYILVKKIAPEDVKRDDVICFYSSDPAISGLPNTHRVVKDPIITDNGIEYVTMGDANAGEDKYTAKGEDLIGRYVKPLDGLGAFVSMLDGGGMTVLFVALQLMVLAMVISTFLRARKEAMADATENKNSEEPGLSQEEIEKIIGDNPELVKEIEEKLGLSSPSKEDNGKDI